MKKFTILGLSLMIGVAASAQLDIVKDVERTIKGDNADYVAAKAALQPALTNDETKGLAQTWFVAGQIGFKYYDALYLQKQLGQPVDGKVAGEALISGYENMMKALPLDSVVNEKGKVKTKYSKDIVNDIVGHYNDFYTAGVGCWEAKDWAGAYKVWGIWVDMPKNKSLGKKAPQAQADTIVAEIVYNQALAAWQMNELNLAIDKMVEAKNMGYKKKQLFDYAISIAAQSQKNDVVYQLAEEAYPLYGKEDPTYFQLMINARVDSKKYDEAKKMLDEAIAADPNNGQYYNLMGFFYDSTSDNENAIKYFRLAVEKDPSLAHARYNLGYALYKKGGAIQDKSINLPSAEFNKIADTQITPLYKEAVTHLEEAYKLEPDTQNGSNALSVLKRVYYILGDEENLKRVNSL